MHDPAHYEVVGSWQITSSDMWDRDFLTVANPAHFTLDDAQATVRSASALLTSAWTSDTAGRPCSSCSPASTKTTTSGDGNAEIADDIKLEIELHFVDGDEPTLTAQPETSSAAV